jgi:hypothetical protein
MRICALVALWALVVSAYAGERLSETNVDIRTVMAFKVADAALQKLVPTGWEVGSPPAGPAKGANLFVVLVDGITAADADGKSAAPLRGGVLVVAAKKKGSDAAAFMVVYGIVVREVAPGAYGVYVPGKAAIERKVEFGTGNHSAADEKWSFEGEDGNAIQARVQYTRGATTRLKAEQKAYSGAKPEFFRIYRVDQVVDLVRSKPAAVDHLTRVSFKASGSKLAPLFDGSEQLISVTSIPSYSRTVFLPD